MTSLSDETLRMAVAFVLEEVDVSQIDEDAIRRSQDRFDLSVVEVTEVLWRAFGPDGKRLTDGPLLRNLIDGEAAESLEYAESMDFVVDGDAPALEVDTVTIGDRAVRRLGLGAMRLVSASIVRDGTWLDALGLPYSPEENRHVLRNAIEGCGIDYVDVARGYGPWEGAGEGVLRDWLQDDDPVLASTKAGYGRDEHGAWFVDLSCARLRDDIRRSKAQLGRAIPLMYMVCRSTAEVPVHNVDEPMAARLAVMQAAQDAGDIERIGLANATAEEIDQARGAVDLCAVQNKFGLDELADPRSRAALERAARHNIPFVTWGIFGEGRPEGDSSPLDHSAAALDVSPRELTIALLLAAAPNLLCLPGPSRRETLYSCVRGANLRVPDDIVARHIRRIDA